MNLIDPFQFRDLFRETRSVAVVGNAPSVLTWENGRLIDGHDMVVRFNRARTEGMEDKVGSRTDVLFVNASNNVAKAPPPSELNRPKCLVCFVSPGGTRTLDDRPFREWVGDVPILVTFGPDMLGHASPVRTKPLTSGTYALFTILRLFEVNKLFVTGFTMFGAVAGGDGKYWNEAAPAAATAHDLDHEAVLFSALLAEFGGELVVTEEVRALVRRTGVGLGGSGLSASRLPRRSLKKWLAEGLSWRLLKAGMVLRRAAQTR
jgi:hypothetical protein